MNISEHYHILLGENNSQIDTVYKDDKLNYKIALTALGTGGKIF